MELWFERVFDFSFSTRLYPNICARLRGTPARLEDILSALPADVLIQKPNQKWSAQEHAGHLLELEPLWLMRTEDYVRGSAQLTATDLRNRKTDQANYNGQPLEQILARFRAERAKLLARLEDVDSTLHARSIPHPRLQRPMRLVDHLYFVAEHDDHHLAAIWDQVQPANSRV
jgi:uncharacterized damage-inducible protein DinB